MSKKPWNDWYHVTVHVYGSWLRGDPRGWRARHHREHVEGDYKNPHPRGTYDALLERSKNLMQRDPVRIAAPLRTFVLSCIIEKLQHERVEAIAASLDAKHLHVLARFPDHDPRHWIGLAKKHASHSLRQSNLRTDPGGLWAKRSRAEPITARAHQLNTFRYILNHASQGAATWRVTVSNTSSATRSPNDEKSW